MKKTLGITLLLLSLVGCSVGESRGYKAGWNDGVDSLAGGAAYAANQPSCSELADVWVHSYTDLTDTDRRDFIKGCEDWRVSGDAGLQRK